MILTMQEMKAMLIMLIEYQALLTGMQYIVKKCNHF